MKTTSFIAISVAVVLIVLVIVYYRFFAVSVLAKRKLGIAETGNNGGFDTKRFEAQMRAVGWKQGDAWCMYFAKMIWLKAHPLKRKELYRLITGNTYQTLSNFENDQSGHYTVSNEPTKGAIVIFPEGHAGLVLSTKANGYTTIEGNVSDKVIKKQYDMVFNGVKFISL